MADYKKSSVHCHSTMCDGKNTLQDMASAACAQGLTTLGFTGHSYTQRDREYCMSPSRTAQYKATIAKLKAEYRGKVDILCGIEWDILSEDKRTGYDYWIGSAHHLYGKNTGKYYESDFRPQDLWDCINDDFDADPLAAVEAYFAAVEKVADTFKMVYTPFHGTGYKLIPEALKRLGMKHVICVPEQMVIDGDFPTVVSPNPENPEGFYLAVDIAKKEGADFILGSDPDADRVGIMVRTKDGEFKVISGNQTGVLLLDYLIGAMKRSGKLPEKPVALKTIVTTEMARKVAEVNGLQSFDTFTGFKFLAEKKDKLENSGEGKVIFAYEESYGYMVGDYVRDKDAVTASLLLTEMAAWYAAQGMTLADALDALYEKYGYFAEHTYNLVMPGLDGLRDMANLMKSLRENPPAEISGVKVVTRKDYQDGSVTDTATGAQSCMELSGSNVLRFEMADGTSVIVRPSGTEPKIKVYILAQGKDAADAAANVEKYGKWVDGLKK